MLNPANATRVTIQVIDYLEASDEFTIFMDMPDAPCGGGSFCVDSVMFACLLRQWGEPSEFVGKTFTLEF